MGLAFYLRFRAPILARTRDAAVTIAVKAQRTGVRNT